MHQISRQLTGMLLLLTLLGSSTSAVAIESERRVGRHQVYFSALTSTFIQPEIAYAVGIERDVDLGVLNIAVHTLEGQAVKVKLKGHTQDLLQRKEALDFLLVEEGPAIYYLANFEFSDQEVLHFIVEVTPPEGRSFQLKFNRTMYRDSK